MSAADREIAAQVLGMKTEEIRGIELVEGGAIVTTHDGQRHGINDEGELVPLSGAFTPAPDPVLHQAGPAPQLVPGELIPGTRTTANTEGDGGVLVDPLEQHDLTGVTFAEIAQVVGAEFGIDPAAVRQLLDAEFGGEEVPELVGDDELVVEDSAAIEDQGAAVELADDDELADEPVPDPAPVPADGDRVPTGNADVVLEWVGDDQDRARRALELEEAKTTGKRGTLVTKLRRVVGAE